MEFTTVERHYYLMEFGVPSFFDTFVQYTLLNSNFSILQVKLRICYNCVIFFILRIIPANVFPAQPRYGDPVALIILKTTKLKTALKFSSGLCL